MGVFKQSQKGFTVIAQGWVVERTFSWLKGFRRLSRDFELLSESAAAFVMIAHSMMLLKRVAIS